ncbi:hypothetical protein ACA910_007600 [Epithemia clementina (nom. ined.)]
MMSCSLLWFGRLGVDAFVTTSHVAEQMGVVTMNPNHGADWHQRQQQQHLQRKRCHANRQWILGGDLSMMRMLSPRSSTSVTNNRRQHFVDSHASTRLFRQRTTAGPGQSTRSTSTALKSSLSSLLFSISIISPTDRWGNWMVLFGSAAMAQVMGQNTAVGRLLGPPVTAMALTFALATIGVLPAGGTDASRSLQQIALQLATPLVLLGADLRNVGRRCGPMLLSFALAATATTLACLLGWMLVGPSLSVALPAIGSGNEGLILAAALLAKNVGGGINYMAVCGALNASPTAIAAGLCVDNIFALVYFPATSFLAAGRPDPAGVSITNDAPGSETENATAQQQPQSKIQSSSSSSDKGSVQQQQSSGTTATVTSESPSTTSNGGQSMITVEQISATLFVSASLLYWGQTLGSIAGDRLGGGITAAAYSLPLCTILTILLASVCPEKWIRRIRAPSQVLGTVALYVFFSTAGAPGLAVAESVRASVLPLSLFLTVLYTFHGGFLWLLHKMHSVLRRPSTTANTGEHNSGSTPTSSLLSQSLEVPRLLCASSAAIGGPATAVALAAASEWESLQVPSLLVGNLGYAVATFLGLAFHAFFSPS